MGFEKGYLLLYNPDVGEPIISLIILAPWPMSA